MDERLDQHSEPARHGETGAKKTKVWLRHVSVWRCSSGDPQHPGMVDSATSYPPATFGVKSPDPGQLLLVATCHFVLEAACLGSSPVGIHWEINSQIRIELNWNKGFPNKTEAQFHQQRRAVNNIMAQLYMFIITIIISSTPLPPLFRF